VFPIERKNGRLDTNEAQTQMPDTDTSAPIQIWRKKMTEFSIITSVSVVSAADTHARHWTRLWSQVSVSDADTCWTQTYLRS